MGPGWSGIFLLSEDSFVKKRACALFKHGELILKLLLLLLTSSQLTANESCTVGLDNYAPYWTRELDPNTHTYFYQEHPSLSAAINSKKATLASSSSQCGPLYFEPSGPDPMPFYDRGVYGGNVRSSNCPISQANSIWPSGTSICTCPFGQKEVDGECIDDAKDAGEPECPNSVGNPINAGAGNKFQIEYDYVSAGGELVFSRTYNSDGLNRSGNLGIGWINNFDRSLSFPISSRIAVMRSDGKVFNFNLVSGDWVSDADVSSTLSEMPSNLGWRYLNATTGDVELYDNKGRLQSVTRRDGYTQSLIYSDGTSNGGYFLDANGNPTLDPLPKNLLVAVTDSYGRIISFGYDAFLRLVKMVSPESREFRYSYDSTYSSRNLVAVIYPDGTERTYIYNEAVNTSGENFPHALTGIVDESLNRYATFKYDGLGRAVSTEHAGGVEQVLLTFTVDGSGKIASSVVTDALDISRTYSFDDVLDVAKIAMVSRPCPGCSAFSTQVYDANGNVSSRTDFKGRTTNYLFESTRNLQVSRTNAIGTTEENVVTTTWHPTFRLPISITEPGKVTTFSYDANGNLLSETVASVP